MADMIHYSAIFELPDGEHHMHGWADSMSIARLHVDQNILGRRRALIPSELCKLISIRQVDPAKVDEVIATEDARLAAKYPERLPLTDMFDVPNRVLERPVTPEE